MKKSYKRIIGVTLIAFFVFAICMVANIFVLVESEAFAENDYIATTKDFVKALQQGKNVIYVDTISFDTQTEVQINYPVEIIGREEKSTISNVNFSIVGTNLASKNMEITFKNIIFDGKVDKNQLEFVEGSTFDELFGETPQYHCFDGCVGYYTLTIDSCEIKNYLCADGPAIYINNDPNYRAGSKTLNLKNTKIHNNISNAGTVKVFSDVLRFNVENCEFCENTARAGQGFSVGNGKTIVTDSTVHDNYFFRFVYYMERKYPAVFHDDIKTYKGLTTNSLGACCGAVYIGGSHATLDRCKVYNNKTIFGGGIGITNAPTLEKDEKIEVKNTEIKNNTALLCGGAIYLESNQGETTYFTNCTITGNKAEKGSVIYTTTYSPGDDKSYGGNIQFSFCTMVDNTASDTGTFAFYDLIKPELGGNLSLKGCFVLDESPYAVGEEEYSYVATKQQALLDNVITEEKLLNLEKGIIPNEGSPADIMVPADIYSAWLGCDPSTLEARKIGAEVENVDAPEKKDFPYWVLTFPVLIVIGVVCCVFYVKKKKAKSKKEKEGDDLGEEEIVASIDYQQIPYEELLNRVGEILSDKVLTKKELEVATMMLTCDKRKEIAERLFLSEDTIKTHISHIFKKMNISSRTEYKVFIDKFFVKEQNEQNQ